MIWSRKQLVGPRMAPDEVNPRTLELEGAKVFDIRAHEVDGMIMQRMDAKLLA